MGSYTEHLGVAGGAGAFTKFVDAVTLAQKSTNKRLQLNNGGNPNRRIVITSFKTYSTGRTLYEFDDAYITAFSINNAELRNNRNFKYVRDLFGGSVAISGASSGGSDISTAIGWQNTPFFVGIPLESFDLTFGNSGSNDFVSYTYVILEKED